MKKITFLKINKIKECKLRIFEAEDDDYPNYRIISANERAIEHYLKEYDDEQKEELRENIQWHNDNCVKKLMSLGWKVTKGVNK